MADGPAPVSAAGNATTSDNNAPPTTDAAQSATAEPITNPLTVVPEVSKPADTPAATANGDNAAPSSAPVAGGIALGINGTEKKIEPIVPEVSKQAAEPAPATGESAPAATNSDAAADQPAVMTGALPPGDESKADGATAAEDDGVKDMASSKPEVSEPPSKPVTSNGDDKANGEEPTENTAVPTDVAAASAETKDTDMPDAAPSAAAPTTTSVTAPVSDTTGTGSTHEAPTAAADAPAAPAPASTGDAVTGQKRKADDEENETSPAQEPAAKKHKGALSKVMNKAKGVVDDVKEKAAARKEAKKAKKERAPVGRTQRKTRSQGNAE